ncbi:MAG TPA: hypothetical protein VND64_16310 [Pirellulales bacterium]|nr:hypothetical protein [Pirellulales bacterium]
MYRTKTKATVDYNLTAGLGEARRKLLSQADCAERLEKPLAYWVVSGDRRLPFAFLDRALGELVETPLADLLATPGIGIRKVQTLIMLLNRASQPLPPGALAPPVDVAPKDLATANGHADAAEEVDAAIVSEALWVQWQATVTERHLEQETLGRLVQTLRDLPRVIWRWPLSNYTNLSLAEVRSLKTHGVKRVNAVLEVFGNLHAILAHAGRRPHLAVQVVPQSIVALETWVMDSLESREPITLAEVQERFVTPLLNQVRIDATSQVAKLAERRMSSSGATVRQAAQRLGLTRARVYQLLDEVAEIVAVRWPMGRLLIGKMREKLHAAGIEDDAKTLFDAACELFFAVNEEPTLVASDSTFVAEGRSTPRRRPNLNRGANGRIPQSAESNSLSPRPPVASRQGLPVPVTRANGQAQHLSGTPRPH